MSDDNTRLTTDDLQTTDLGQNPAPVNKRPHRATDGSRGGDPVNNPRGERTPPERTTVRVDEVIPPASGGESQTQAEARAARRKLAEEKAKQEAANKIIEMVDGKINPMLAVVSRNVLQVPPEVDFWMEVPRNVDGEIEVDRRGIPKYRYSPAAQAAILQPYEVEILTMIAPSLNTEELTVKMEKFGKKAAPFVAVGAGLAFAATYVMRMRQVKVGLDRAIADYNEERRAEAGTL